MSLRQAKSLVYFVALLMGTLTTLGNALHALPGNHCCRGHYGESKTTKHDTPDAHRGCKHHCHPHSEVSPAEESRPRSAPETHTGDECSLCRFLSLPKTQSSVTPPNFVVTMSRDRAATISAMLFQAAIPREVAPRGPPCCA